MKIAQRAINLLKKAFDDCVFYQSMRKPSFTQLKGTHIWSSFDTLCQVLNVDSCWFYEYITGIKCGCNPETKKRFQEVFNRIKGV